MNLAVVVYTCCDRTLYATRCIESLGNIQWGYRLHIANDGGSREHMDALLDASALDLVTTTDTGGRGYGASYNAATQALHADYDAFLCVEDDWELTKDLPIGKLLQDLEYLGDACIRLGYIGFTQALIGEFVNVNGRHYLRLDPDSPEPHVFSVHPRWESRGLQGLVGPWPEGLPAGTTEFDVAHRRKAREDVYWPAWLVLPHGDLFVHIGSESTK